jgi:ribosomal protein S18 acetylase RimI-like enzyme
VGNEAARAFYESAGFQPYSLELEMAARKKNNSSMS